jgi:hypothetical protein
MAIYTTFFLARLDALAGGFPGWQPPRREPVQRISRNPFTGEMKTIATSEPDWPDTPPPVRPRVVAIEGDYEAYLEARLPAFVRERPHWATKGVTDVELQPLLAAAKLPDAIETPLYAPPSLGATLRALPVGLGAWSKDDAARIARAWSAELSSPRHTHSRAGKRLKPDFSEADAQHVVDALTALAQRAGSGDRMLLLVEW